MNNLELNALTIVDCHCDTILEAARGVRKLRDRSSAGHIDIPRLIEGHVSVEFFALYIEPQYKPIGALERTLKLIDVFYKELTENPEHLEQILEFSDIQKIKEKNKIGALLTVEGGEGIQEDLSLLRTLFRLGVRGITLTWNQRNAIADGASEGPHGGISRFGETVIYEMNRLGMLIDVSHINRTGFLEVVEKSTRPVIASHSNARALCDHPRNLDDHQIRLLAEHEGVVCVTFVPDFLVSSGKKATIEAVADHVDYVRNLVGIDYIGIGSDFDGVDEVPTGLENISKMPDFISVLKRRGYTQQDLEKVCGGNVIRLLKKVMQGG